MSRTTGHGIAAAAGKLGGFFGVFLFPIFMAWGGLTAAEAAAATVSVLGAIVALTMLPETKGKSLEELNQEAAEGAAQAAGAWSPKLFRRDQQKETVSRRSLQIADKPLASARGF
jgi:dipeptide/tripeptide permease